jgi:predicted small secreted protein
MHNLDPTTAFSLIASFVLLFLLSGCNTVSGFGKDVQKVGKKMESAADRHIR